MSSITINSSALRNLILSTPYSIALNSISQKLRKFSSRLINTVEPDDVSGFTKTKIYTEVNTNFEVGDRVFIVNGNYDSNVRIKKDRYRAGNDGYKILKIDRCAITIDLDYAGTIPWIATNVDDHIKIWSCFSQDEVSYQSQIRIDNTLTEQFRFEFGLNSILYCNATYSTIFGTVSGGFSVLDQPSVGTYSWVSISGSFSTNNLSSYVSPTQSGNVLIMGEDFEYNSVKFRTTKVYGFTNSNWKSNHLYSSAILSKSNFRDGEFNGAWSDGVYGSYDKRIIWKKRDNSSWTSGIGLNMTWESGDMLSASDAIIQNSFYATLDKGLVKQSTDKSNNKSWGYNYLLDSDFYNGLIYNGNFEGGHFGQESFTSSAVNNYINSTTYSTLITAKSGRFSGTELYEGDYTNVAVDTTQVISGKFSKSTILNSHLTGAVLTDSSRFKADSSIKVTDTNNFYYYDYFESRHTVRYKLYINESDIVKLKNLDIFYLKGLKFNKDSKFDKFENVFYLNNHGEKIKTFYGLDMLGQVKCEVKTATENNVIQQTNYQLFQFFALGFIIPTTTTIPGLSKPSLDITLEFDFPGAFGPYNTILQYYNWVQTFNRLDIVDNPYILDAEYESGVMDNSTWESGNIINNWNYQIKQDSTTNRLVANATTATTLNLNLKTSTFYTSWLDSNIKTGDIIHLDNVVWQADYNPTTSIPETLEQYSINGAYMVANTSFGINRSLTLQAYDQDAIANLSTMYNAQSILAASYSINGFFYTYDSVLLNPTVGGINSWFNYSMPNFISLSKIKIMNSTVQSGVFARTFFKDTTVYNKDFNNFDTTLSRTNIDTLKLVNFILTSTGQNLKTSHINPITSDYFTQNRIGNNTNIKSGFVFNSISNHPVWNNGILHDSYWVHGTWNNGLAKSIDWINGIFNNGNFIDSISYDPSGNKITFTMKWGASPTNPDLYVDWMQNPYGYGWGSGDFYNGEMSNSVWGTGNKWSGKIFNTIWYYGNHYTGEFGDTNYKREDSQMLSGHWYNGVANNVTIGSNWLDSIIWDTGEFNGGLFTGGDISSNPINWIDTMTVSGGTYLGLIVPDPTNVYNGMYGTGTNILINKFNDNLNSNYNTYTTITGISILGTYAVIETGLTATVPLGTMESGTLIKKYSIWKDGTFNNGYFSGYGSVWLNGNFNNGFFNANMYIYDHAQFITASELGYAPYKEQRNNYNVNWHNGNFNNGLFQSSWANGIWHDGRFEGKVWKNGTFKKGQFIGSSMNFFYDTMISNFTGGVQYSAITQQELFNMYYRNPANNFRGLWLNGNVIDDVRKVARDEQIFSDLVRRKDDVSVIQSVKFENVKWMDGIVDHLNVEFDNILWMNGVWRNGTWNSGAFNPFVTRDTSIYYINFGATATCYTPLYVGSDGISGHTFSMFQYDDTCIWMNGTWNGGEFYYSNWNNGLWKNGTMSGGIWNSGTWWYGDARNILWIDGTWKNGNWYGSDYAVTTIVDGPVLGAGPDGNAAGPGLWNGQGQVLYNSSSNLYHTILLSRIDNKLIELGLVETPSLVFYNTGFMDVGAFFLTGSWHLWNAFDPTSTTYNAQYNNKLVDVVREPYGISSETNYYMMTAATSGFTGEVFSTFTSWTYSHNFGSFFQPDMIYAKVGNARFLSGVWENGVWNNGWRADTQATSFGYSKYVEFDSISQFVQLARNNWQFTVAMTTGTFSNLIPGDRVSIGNVVTYDINDNRRLIKGYYTVTSVSTNSFTVETIINFPIRRIVKDSDAHRILVTKNVWLSGAFLNGKFTGIWNSGLFTGFPFITAMDKTQWIDGRFEGGHFIATQSFVGATHSTGLIQKMQFKDQDESITASVHKYDSWMDINYDKKYVTNLALDNIVIDAGEFGNPGNRYTKANYQGMITYDVLESISNLRDHLQTRFKDYNLGTKYTRFVDFIDSSDLIARSDTSKFNKPNIYEQGWTVSDVKVPTTSLVGTMSSNIYQNVTNNLPNYPNEPSLFINKGDGSTLPYGVTPSYFTGALDKYNFGKICILSNTSINIEPNRYSMVEFDVYTWSGGPGVSTFGNFAGGANDMYGNRTVELFGFLNYGYFENLFFEPASTNIGGGRATPYADSNNPVRNNPDINSKKMEFFYNRLDMDMYIGGSFSAVFDNLKFYEVDMIPFFKYYADDSLINTDLQRPYTARAPYIDYSNQNYSFIDNVVISLDSIISGGVFETLVMVGP